MRIRLVKMCFVTGAFWLAFIAIDGSAVAADDLTAIAISGHRNTVESIDTLYTKVQLDMGWVGKPPNGTRKAIYWRERGIARVRETQNDGTVLEYQQRQGTVSMLFSQPRPDVDPRAKAVGMAIDKDSKHFIETDAWTRALLILPTLYTAEGIYPRYSLAEAVERMRLQSCTWRERDGRKVVELKLKGIVETTERTHNIDYTVYLDPDINWMIREVHLEIRAPKLPDWDCTYVADGFSEVAPSIYFPATVQAICKMQGLDPIAHTAAFTETVVNKRPKLPFTLELPIPKEGVYVTDKIKGITYQADANGQPIGAPSALREMPALPATPLDLEAKTYNSTSRLLAVVAISSACAAALVYFVRRRIKSRRLIA